MGAFIDLVGQKFGKLTALYVVARAKRGTNTPHTVWMCQCECSALSKVSTNDLRSGHTQTCGDYRCRTQQKKLEVGGQTFGYLTTTATFVPTKGWLCYCVCGNNCYAFGSKLENGFIRSCGCKSVELGIQANTLPDDDALTNYLLGNYRRGAAERSLTFSLSRDQFRSIVMSDCFYCGQTPSLVAKFQNPKYSETRRGSRANGIDRKDNSIGYSPDNCVCSCIDCNQAKNNLSYDTFIDWLTRIVDTQTAISNTVAYTKPYNDPRTIDRLYKQYAYGANKNNRCFNIGKAEFEALITGQCFYCAAPPEKYKISTKYAENNRVIGIDRRDNDLGYCVGNVVSCCLTCNRAKMAKSIEEFEAYIARIVVYRLASANA